MAYSTSTFGYLVLITSSILFLHFLLFCLIPYFKLEPGEYKLQQDTLIESSDSLYVNYLQKHVN